MEPHKATTRALNNEQQLERLDFGIMGNELLNGFLFCFVICFSLLNSRDYPSQDENALLTTNPILI